MRIEAEKALNDPVIQYMRADFAQLNMKQTVEDALNAIRKNPPEGRIIYFYVVDDDNHLKGVIPTRRLLLNSPETTIDEIMIRELITIPNTATVYDACELFVSHRLLAFPVIDQEQRLLGVIDVELYTDELRDFDKKEVEDEIFQLIGIHLIDTQHASNLTIFNKRFPWLIANIIGGILAAFLSGLFETELQNTVALALFIPIVLALSESVSIQSVSLALQVIHGKKPTVIEIFKKLISEFVTGLFLGIACALTVSIVALLWLGQMYFVLCLLVGIASGVTCAAMIGVLVPNLIRYFHREPHVASGPLSLAITDMVTLLIYFSLARWLLG